MGVHRHVRAADGGDSPAARPRRLKRRLRGLAWAAAWLALAEAACAGAAEEKLRRARDLMEQFVLSDRAEPHDQLEALGHIAHLADSAPVARGVAPLYGRAIQAARVTDGQVGRALAEGFAACLLRAGHSSVEAARALRREARGRAGTPVGLGLVAVADRLAGEAGRGEGAPPRVARPAVEGVGATCRSIDVARLGLPEVRAPAAPALPPRLGPRSGDEPAVARVDSSALGSGPARRVPDAARPDLQPVRPPEWRAVAKASAPETTAAAAAEAASVARRAAGRAGASVLAQMVKELIAEADWKLRQGDKEGAVDVLAVVLREAPDSAASAEALPRALSVALSTRKGGSREAAVGWFREWVARYGGRGDRVEAELLVLQQQYRAGRFADARAGLERFLSDHAGSPLVPRAHVLLALATWRDGERGPALERLQALVRAYPLHEAAPRAQFLAGYLLVTGGDDAAAQAAFLRVIDDFPASPFAQKAIEFLETEAVKRLEAEPMRAMLANRPTAACPRARPPVRVDGRLDEPAWARSPAVRLTRDGDPPAPDPDATVRLLWDDTALYLGFECRDADLRSDARERDDPVWLWDSWRVLLARAAGPGGEALGPLADDVEVFFDLAVSPGGVWSDRRQVVAQGGGVAWEVLRKAAAWECAGLQCAAAVDGTLNDAIPDRGWSAELAIPFDALGRQAPRGATWRANFLRTARDGERGPVASIWAPMGLRFPRPELFGRVTFVTDEPR